MSPAARSPFRHLNESVGAFLLITVVIIIAGFVLAGRAKHWFAPVQHIALLLPVDGSFGLRDGADVNVMGTTVGSVDDISVKDNGRMIAAITIRKDFARFVRADSVATIRKQFGIGGDAFVSISRGTGSELPSKDAELNAVADRGPTDLLQDLIEQIRNQAVPAVQEIRGAVREYTGLAKDLRNPQMPLQQLIAKLDHIAATVDKGQGVVGRLLADQKWAGRVDASLAELNDSLAQLHKTIDTVHTAVAKLDHTVAVVDQQSASLPQIVDQTKKVLSGADGTLQNLQKATASMPEVMQSVNDSARSMPALVLQVQSTMRQVERLTEALQRNWLIRGGVTPDNSTQRISPGEAGDYGATP